MLNPAGCDPIYYGKMVILVATRLLIKICIIHTLILNVWSLYLQNPVVSGAKVGKYSIDWVLGIYHPSFSLGLIGLFPWSFVNFAAMDTHGFSARRWELPSFPWQCDRHRNPTSSATAEVVKGRFRSPKKVGRLREVCHWVISSISHPAVYSCIGEKDIVGEPTHGG